MGRCRRHPHHIVVGVCAYCLNEQLSAVLDRQGYELGGDGSSHHLPHYKNLSPSAFTSSNPSTVPESPFVPTHRAPLPRRLPFDPGLNAEVAPKASAHQCFSLSFSPQAARLKSVDSNTSSYISSPHNQVFPGNYDFIKGEIPRKKKTSFWSFLLRRKAGLYNSCGTTHLRRNYALDQDVTYSDMSDNDWNVPQPLRYRVQNMHPTSRDMHPKDGKSVPNRQAQSNSLLSSMYVKSFGRDNAAVRRAFLPQSSASPNGYHQYPLSKHRSSHIVSPGPKTAIGRSPLRYEKCGNYKESSLPGFQSAAHEFDRYADAYRSHVGLSSSWLSSIYPQEFRRSKSISGLSEVDGSEPTIKQPTCRSSPDNEATRARSVSIADEEINASPKSMSDANVIKMGQCRSSNRSRQGLHRHGRSPKSSSPYGYHYSGALPIPGLDHNLNLEGYPRFEVHTDRKSQDISKSAPSLLSRSRKEMVSIECRKANRVSPLMPAAQKGSSPHGLYHSTHDQYVSPQHRNHASQTHDDDGDVNEGMLSYMPPYQPVDHDSSTMPSDDELCRSPSLFDIYFTKQNAIIPGRAQSLKMMGIGHHSKELPVKEPAFGSHVFAYSTRSLSKALGNMLRMRRAKKQNVKKQAMSPLANHESYIHVHQMDKVKDLRNRCNESHQNAVANDEDDSDFIDYDQSDLYHESLPPQQQNIVHAPRQPLKDHILQAKESQALSGMEEKGPPQQYSFLSRDYSAFSCYFSPPQTFQSIEALDTRMTKQMQVGDGTGWMSRASNPMSPSSRAMRGIHGRSGRA